MLVTVAQARAPWLQANAARPLAAARLTTFDQLSQARFVDESMRSIFRRLGAITRLLGGVSPLGSAQEATSLALGLPAGDTTTLTSVEEINASTTSFSPYEPTWTSQSRATVDGTYTGTVDETFTVRISYTGKVASVGSDSFTLRVFDSAGTKLVDTTIDATYAPGGEIALADGLVLRLGAGTLEKNDSFDVVASASSGEAVQQANAFDGIGNDDARLEYGRTVTDGSFTVNGTTIAVYAGDSIDTLVARINAVSPDVTARFDVTTERVVLEARTAGPEPIVLTGDTSGVLDALKLSSATSVPGHDGSDVTLDQIAAFAGVTTGSFTIGGTAIVIDPTTDSLRSLIDRINSSGAPVTARLVGDRVSLSPDGTDVAVADGGTGFLAALGIADGVIGGTGLRTGMSSTRADRIVDELADLLHTIDRLFRSTPAGGHAGRRLQHARDGIERAIRGAFGGEDAERLTGRFGIEFDFSDTALRTTGLRASGQRRLERALRSGDRDLLTFLTSDDRDEGGDLLGRLARFARAAIGTASVIDLSL